MRRIFKKVTFAMATSFHRTNESDSEWHGDSVRLEIMSKKHAKLSVVKHSLFNNGQFTYTFFVWLNMYPSIKLGELSVIEWRVNNVQNTRHEVSFKKEEKKRN